MVKWPVITLLIARRETIWYQHCKLTLSSVGRSSLHGSPQFKRYWRDLLLRTTILSDDEEFYLDANDGDEEPELEEDQLVRKQQGGEPHSRSRQMSEQILGEFRNCDVAQLLLQDGKKTRWHVIRRVL